MSPRVVVRTEPFVEAARALDGPIVGPPMGAAERLCAELATCGSMAGTDPVGVDWANTYDDAAASAVTAAQDLINGTVRVAALLAQTGRNHERADAASTPGAFVPDPWTADAEWREQLTLPPPAGGGTVPTPFGWSLVEHWVGYLWPNGHQDRLHRAARAWHESSRFLLDASERFWQPYELVGEVDSPEVSDALGVLESLRLHYGDLAHAHGVLGDSCDALARHIDEMHAAVEDALVELVAWTAGIEVIGGLLSIITLGLAEGVTQAEVLTRILATADRIKSLYEAMRIGIAAWVDSLPTIAGLAETIRLALVPLTNARLVTAGVADVRAAREIVMEARAQRGLEAAATRVEATVTKSDSPIWRGLKPYRGRTKTNGLQGSERRYYQWDHRHNDIEVYDGRNKHLGSMDPVSGVMTKPAVTGRELQP